MKIRFILGLSITVVCILLSISSASAVTLTASPNPATINKEVTFSIGVQFTSVPGDPGCNVIIDYGDGGPNDSVNFRSSTTRQTSHVYPQAGSYTANARVTDCALSTVAPNPVFLNVRVADFEIKRIELLFDNDKSQVTLQRNQPAPGLTALVNFSGTEFVRGYWEVDGIRQQAFSRQLSMGPQAVFEYPKIPGLKTFKQGSHVIRFVITHPILDITFPKAIYYVTAEKYLKVNDINILSLDPGGDRTTAGMSITWQAIPLTEIYMVHVFANKEGTPVFSAYSRENSYHIRPEIVAKIRERKGPYYIQIEGFHEDTRITGQSEKELIQLTQ